MVKDAAIRAGTAPDMAWRAVDAPMKPACPETAARACGGQGLALAVLHAFLFDRIDRKTGKAEPTRAAIASAAVLSIRSVDRGLAKLKAAGVLNWIRQCNRKLINCVSASAPRG